MSETNDFEYHTGFGNHFATEALPDVLPVGQNNPQHVKYGLYTEGITGTSFVASPRARNQRTWLYRIRPAVVHQGFEKLPANPDVKHRLMLFYLHQSLLSTEDNAELEANFSTLNPNVYVSPTQLAWKPFPLPPDSAGDNKDVDFVNGLKTIAGCGEPGLGDGLAIHVYMFNRSMGRKAFVSTDGHFLIVPELGTLIIQTELGKITVPNGSICVIPRGIRFKVLLPKDTPVGRGYILESFGANFELPELGPLGHSGLALERDFEIPVAHFDDVSKEDYGKQEWQIIYKVQGELQKCQQGHTPFDVVAWHGNYVPYRYNLTRFVHVGSISVDHIDPSIFCVLTCPSSSGGGSPLADFLLFSPRWDVANHTYRPPWYHRNCSSEVMGLIRGAYAGRSDDFQPGGMSFESSHVPHGVAHEQWKAATESSLEPQWISEGVIAFMFEVNRQLTITDYAFNRSGVKHEHNPDLWESLKPNFLEYLSEIKKKGKAKDDSEKKESAVTG